MTESHVASAFSQESSCLIVILLSHHLTACAEIAAQPLHRAMMLYKSSLQAAQAGTRSSSPPCYTRLLDNHIRFSIKGWAYYIRFSNPCSSQYFFFKTPI